MLSLFTKYQTAVGGAEASALVARGAVRGAARLAHRDARGALAEAAGEFAAPAVNALLQLSRLGVEVCGAVAGLTGEVLPVTCHADARARAPARQFAPPAVAGPVHRQRCRLTGYLPPGAATKAASGALLLFSSFS